MLNLNLYSIVCSIQSAYFCPAKLGAFRVWGFIMSVSIVDTSLPTFKNRKFYLSLKPSKMKYYGVACYNSMY